MYWPDIQNLDAGTILARRIVSWFGRVCRLADSSLGRGQPSLRRGKERQSQMRKIRIVGFGLFAVLALCALNVAPAFAESEWLVEKAKVETTLNAETEGFLKLVKFASSGSTTILEEILCEGILDGTMKEKEDTILDILSFNQLVTVGSLGDSNEEFLNCLVVFDAGGITDCLEGTLILVWLDGLNLELEAYWLTAILLVGSSFFDDRLSLNNLGEPAGYDVECESKLGIFGSELCSESEPSAALSNVTGSPASVLGVFSLGPVAGRVNCTMTGEHSADLVGEFNTWAIGVNELERLETAVS